MDDVLAHKLAQLRQSPYFDTLQEYLKKRIEGARDQLEFNHDVEMIYEMQGELHAFRSILKDFEQLELFRGNSSANPDEDKEI